MLLKDKKILLGVGGGIAVYRAVELMRLLMKQGADVRCVMSKSAQAFVTPLTFEALSGNKVHVDLFDLTEDHGMGHIQLARWADVIIVAPMTANMMAKVAHGMADDLLTTLLLVADVPVLMAPAMNVSMWEAASTRQNLYTLQQRGFALASPVAGELACGEQGAGRLAEPAAIVDAALPLLTPQSLAGQSWVINAGPTVESWDAVRTMSNRASGTLGAALADAAALQGAEVILIAGVGTPLSHPLVHRVNVESAEQMLKVSLKAAAGADVFVATAAVSDYRFADVSPQKMKRADVEMMEVRLLQNVDIVAQVAGMAKRPTMVIAFAAESENHVAFAKTKLAKKGVDAIVANDVSNMGKTSAAGWWVTAEAEQVLPEETKAMFVRSLIDLIADLHASAA
ncbi:MAG: phosphopantothenoylcysteine synthase [Zetaproteobacteria bacterium CG2_30_46_52]|nr:MAG: phosphopantothenoylcysteine synthase [Zetaproteobacteria bacterium CG2_30_46_52]